MNRNTPAILLPGLVAAAVLLQSCGYSTAPAPIFDESPGALVKHHRVTKGDTLYSIAWSAGVDWKTLARWNHVSSPYLIHPGDKLRLNAPSGESGGVAVELVPAPGESAAVKSAAPAAAPVGNWIWPVRGEVARQFSAANGNKGLDIRAAPGAQVVAAAGGEVVYAGDGLPGYGNIVIIKHNDTYLSAYGYNREISVREGQRLKQGDKIGVTTRGGETPGLMHFQIRLKGKPVDPIGHLPRRGA